MPRPKNAELERERGNRADAFIDVLSRFPDHVITESDLKEYHPHIDWNGNIAETWRILRADATLSPHLRDYGENRTRVYAYLPNPEDDSLLLERLADMAKELEEPSDLFKTESQEGLAIGEKFVQRWWKVAVAAGVAVSAMSAAGVAIYNKSKKSD